MPIPNFPVTNLFFAETKPSEELEKHVSEINILHKKYSEKGEETFDTVLYFKSFKECCSCQCSNWCANCYLPFVCQLVYRSFCECGPCFSLADLRNLDETMIFNKSVTSSDTQTTDVSGETLNENPVNSNTTGDDIPHTDTSKRITNEPDDAMTKTMDGNCEDIQKTQEDFSHSNIQFIIDEESDSDVDTSSSDNIILKPLNRKSDNFYRTRDDLYIKDTEKTLLLSRDFLKTT